MNTKPLALWVQALVFRAAGYSKKSLCLIFVLFSAPQAFAWTDGELLIWISSMIGVPIVLTYTVTIYYVFRGKVVLTEESY